MASRFTCDIPCDLCFKKFKSLKVMSKHSRQRHNKEPNGRPRFLNDTGAEVSLGEPKELHEEGRREEYKKWLATLAERIVEALHPELPAKWCKIEYPVMDPDVFQHFLIKLIMNGAQVSCPHAITLLPHRRLPYKKRTKRVSYRMYSLVALEKVLAEQPVQVMTSALFAGTTPTQDSGLSLTQRLAMARAAGLLSYGQSATQKKTSRSEIVCEETDSRATREMELLWWPDMYSKCGSGKFELRLFINKCPL